jgi:hypothetical protein
MRLLGRITGYLLSALLILMGVYCVLWAFQSASFSLVGDQVALAVYKVRAETMLPIGILSLALGALYFFVIWSTARRQ